MRSTFLIKTSLSAFFFSAITSNGILSWERFYFHSFCRSDKHWLVNFNNGIFVSLLFIIINMIHVPTSLCKWNIFIFLCFVLRLQYFLLPNVVTGQKLSENTNNIAFVSSQCEIGWINHMLWIRCNYLHTINVVEFFSLSQNNNKGNKNEVNSVCTSNANVHHKCDAEMLHTKWNSYINATGTCVQHNLFSKNSWL